jgi:hypothetical protein
LLSLVEGERGFTGRLTEDRVVGRLRTGNHYLTIQPGRSGPALRPGQTVNVNVVVLPHIRRLLVPQNAIAGSGARRNVFVVHDGRIVARA